MSVSFDKYDRLSRTMIAQHLAFPFLLQWNDNNYVPLTVATTPNPHFSFSRCLLGHNIIFHYSTLYFTAILYATRERDSWRQRKRHKIVIYLS